MWRRRALGPVPVQNLPALRSAISGDGKRVASTGSGYLELYDGASGKILARVHSSSYFGSAISALAFDPSGRVLAVAYSAPLDVKHHVGIRLLDATDLHSRGEIEDQ